jgi:hypothetical protein
MQLKEGMKMNKIVPKNPAFLFASVFAPWFLVNTYVILDGNKFVISRYYSFDGETLKKDLVEMNIADLEEAGFSMDLEIERIEKTIQGNHGFYIPQEIDFKTKSGILAFNAKPYTKKQIRYLINYVKSMNSSIIIGKSLTNVLFR